MNANICVKSTIGRGNNRCKDLTNWKKFGMLVKEKKKKLGNSDPGGQGESGR